METHLPTSTTNLILPFPPSVNHYLKHTRRGVFLTDEARTYKETVALLTGQIEPLAGELVVVLEVYRKAKRGDIDNVSKCVLDSLNKRAWFDDGQIVELHIYRFDDKHNPRVEVSVWEK